MIGLENLKEQVCNANLALVDHGLVVLTWGNASAVDRDAGVVAIKPSGVSYARLKPRDITLVSLETGKPLEQGLSPSSDTATHIALYRAFSGLGGVVHTHSRAATSWAQAGKPIPCLGTTHADHFYGEIPITRELTVQEIGNAYEENTGRVIVECFIEGQIEPLHIPGVLVPFHGPFVWGTNLKAAVENAVVFEEVAHMALGSIQIERSVQDIPGALLDKHFLRKHGPGAYYGQESEY